jgi:hypothetical protein
MKRSFVPRTDIDPKILELVKQDYGETCELVHRTEWHYTFNGVEGGPKSYVTISRFKAEKSFEVSAAEIREQWPQWCQCQRIDFAFHWHTKGTWTDNDTEILEIIMADGDDDVWQECTQAFLKHPDRNRAVRFLVDRVLYHTLNPEKRKRERFRDHEPLIYFQVLLGMAKDTRSVAAIRPFYEKYKKIVDTTEPVLGVEEDVFWGPIPYFPYFVTAGALFKISGSPEYEQSIRRFVDHEKEQVRYWAENALGIEGPRTEQRTAEYRHPFTLESLAKIRNQHMVRTTWFGTILYSLGIPRRFFPQRWIYSFPRRPIRLRMVAS